MKAVSSARIKYEKKKAPTTSQILSDKERYMLKKSYIINEKRKSHHATVHSRVTSQRDAGRKRRIQEVVPASQHDDLLARAAELYERERQAYDWCVCSGRKTTLRFHPHYMSNSSQTESKSLLNKLLAQRVIDTAAKDRSNF